MITEHAPFTAALGLTAPVKSAISAAALGIHDEAQLAVFMGG